MDILNMKVIFAVMDVLWRCLIQQKLRSLKGVKIYGISSSKVGFVLSISFPGVLLKRIHIVAIKTNRTSLKINIMEFFKVKVFLLLFIWRRFQINICCSRISPGDKTCAKNGTASSCLKRCTKACSVKQNCRWGVWRE